MLMPTTKSQNLFRYVTTCLDTFRSSYVFENCTSAFFLKTQLAYLKGHELALAQEPHLDEDSSIAASPVRDVKRHKLPVWKISLGKPTSIPTSSGCVGTGPIEWLSLQQLCIKRLRLQHLCKMSL